MIRITDKTTCCGCSSCATSCPKHCISMIEDHEGFLYPQIDDSQCIDCGLCEKVCPELHPCDERSPLAVLAAINKDEEVRLRSSSGGIFSLLAEQTISAGGVVFGARFDSRWQVVLDYADSMAGVSAFMGSKYLQARTGTAYRDAEMFLKQGRQVLFSGSPCQIAGLHHFLRKKYENLTTVDFLCHGIPSPKVWRMYLDEVVSSGLRITDVKFRNKANGWKKFNFVLTVDDAGHTVSLSSWHRHNHYMRAFLSDMILRPSCSDCKAKLGRSQSDITIADFWGIDVEMPHMDDDKGTGLVIVYSERGRAALDWNKVCCQESSIEIASKYNGGFFPKLRPHPKREEFFAKLDTSSSIIDLISKCLRPSLYRRARHQVWCCKQLVKRLLKGPIGGG
ncbi:MAG: Coenzyme F420 hydrogenase/dehydrogenase, beta subunit C-terminal domain [Bacteroidaceae bacterium]